MENNKKQCKQNVAIIGCWILFFVIMFFLAGCSKADRVNYNISEQAENFQIYRRITVINVRDNSMLYELEAFFNLDNTNYNELVVTSEIGHNKFTKDFIYLNDYTTYVVQQLEAENVSPYHYNFIIYPKMIIPATIDIELD